MRKFKVHRDGPSGLQPATSGAGSQGFTSATLVDLADGSTHVEIALCSLDPDGFVGGHLHPFEESFYVLSGEAVVSIGRRPVCVLTRDAAIAVLGSVTCAPITRQIRVIDSEVEVGPEHGLPERAVINCDNVMTIPKHALDPKPVGKLDPGARAQLGRLRYSLDIIY